MSVSDWSSDRVLFRVERGTDGWTPRVRLDATINATGTEIGPLLSPDGTAFAFSRDAGDGRSGAFYLAHPGNAQAWPRCDRQRSEAHTSELQSLMRNPYAVFCFNTNNYTPR